MESDSCENRRQRGLQIFPGNGDTVSEKKDTLLLFFIVLPTAVESKIEFTVLYREGAILRRIFPNPGTPLEDSEGLAHIPFTIKACVNMGFSKCFFFT